jgi:hypothetical protein
MVIELEALLTWWPPRLEVEADADRPSAELTLDQSMALPPIWKQDEIEAGGTLVVAVTVTDPGREAKLHGHPDSQHPDDPIEFEVTGATVELTDDDETFVLDLTKSQLNALDLASDETVGGLVWSEYHED